MSAIIAPNISPFLKQHLKNIAQYSSYKKGGDKKLYWEFCTIRRDDQKIILRHIKEAIGDERDISKCHQIAVEILSLYGAKCKVHYSLEKDPSRNIIYCKSCFHHMPLLTIVPSPSQSFSRPTSPPVRA